jgi:D-glycero-alpha-D-manno-heptose-7-phosphate kinase
LIISRTPFRISLAGGGTDLPDFYREQGGCVTALTITKYMYITVNRRFDHTLRVGYSQMELVNTVDELQHPLVRAALKHTELINGLEVTSMADIPAQTGIGSSSSFTVGLLNALYAYKGMHVSAERLAEEACQIELDLLNEPIGKQDQYCAAFGGLRFIEFNADESVYCNPIICSPQTREELMRHLQLYYTGITRPAASVLKEQKEKTSMNREILSQMKEQATAIRDVLQKGRHLVSIGDLLHQGWMLKRKLASKVSNDFIDQQYETALEAGALGGKILGAGGGGFLLVFVEPQNHEKVRKALSALRPIEFGFEPQGSKIIYVSD